MHNDLENDFLLNMLPSTRCWLGVHDGVQVSQVVWPKDISLFVETNVSNEDGLTSKPN